MVPEGKSTLRKPGHSMGRAAPVGPRGPDSVPGEKQSLL